MFEKENIVFPLLFCGFLAAFIIFDNSYSSENNNRVTINPTHRFLYLYSRPKDTIHLLGDSYLLLSLKKQRVTVIIRGSRDTVQFPVSTGNAMLDKGVNTPPGLYTVQSKSTKAISKQFDDAELFSWVGFNGNIGFHGLKGSGYYSSLGIRPSSHGCVRISREDGAKLFKLVRTGTPVIVYDKEPALHIAFSDIKYFTAGKDIVLEKKDKITDIMIKSRINSLYNGNYYQIADSKLFMTGTSIIRNRGFAIGDASKIADVQYDYSMLHRNIQISPDNTRTILYLVHKPQKKDSVVNNK